MVMPKDKNGKELQVNDQVIAPEPELVNFDYNFGGWSGNILEFREDTDGTMLASVEDGDNDVFDIPCELLELE